MYDQKDGLVIPEMDQIWSEEIEARPSLAHKLQKIMTAKMRERFMEMLDGENADPHFLAAVSSLGLH